MARPSPFAAVAADEELLAAACEAVAHWVPDAAATLQGLAAAHLAVARRLVPRPQRWLKLHVTVRATLAAALAGGLGALTWLRHKEQQLIDRYVDLEARAGLTEGERHLLRRQLVPAAFERFGRVDQCVMLREEQGVYA